MTAPSPAPLNDTVLQIFRKYGLGILYGRDMLQHFLNDVADEDAILLKGLPFIESIPDTPRETDSEELYELEHARDFLSQYLSQLFVTVNPTFPKPDQPKVLKPNPTFPIILTVFIPMIRSISLARPTLILPILNSINKVVKSSKPDEPWDVPEISREIIGWLTAIYVSEHATSDICIAAFSLWLNLISARGTIDDFLTLARAWSLRRFPSDVDKMVADHSDLSRYPRPLIFSDYLVKPELSIPIHAFHLQRPNPSPRIARVMAAANGVLCIADSVLGLLAIGTGHRGTLFSALIARNEAVATGTTPVALAIVNDYVLLRVNALDSAVFLVSLHNFAEVRSISAPPGLFTALRGRLIFVDGANVQEFAFAKDQIGARLREFTLANAQWAPGEAAQLLTDGRSLAVAQGGKLFVCSLESRSQVHVVAEKASAVAFDPAGEFFVKSGDYAPLQLSNASNAFHLHRAWLELPAGELPLLGWWRSAASWVVEGRPGAFRLTDASGDALVAFARDFPSELAPFADTVVFLLAVVYRRFASAPKLAREQFLAILQLPGLTTAPRVEFVAALVYHNVGDLFASYEFCERWISALTAAETVAIFSSGFGHYWAIVNVFLYSDVGTRILEGAADAPDGSLPFLGALARAIAEGIAAKAMTESAVLPLLSIIVRISESPMVEMLLPVVLPFVRPLLWSPVICHPALDMLVQVLRYVQAREPPDSLAEFAKAHRAYRSSARSTASRQIIHESPHPYLNNMNEIKSWDFPGARTITIKFDSRSATENNCDYLEIFTNPARRDRDRIAKLTGSYNRGNWANEITLHSEHLTFRFYSDGSVTDWGYHATIVVIFDMNLPFESPEFHTDQTRLLLRFLIDRFSTPFPELPGFSVPAELPDANPAGLFGEEHAFVDSPAVPSSVRALLAYLLRTQTGWRPSDILMIGTAPRRYVPESPPSFSLIAVNLTGIFVAMGEPLPAAMAAMAQNADFDRRQYASALLKPAETTLARCLYSTEALLRCSRSLKSAVELCGDSLFPSRVLVFNQFFEALVGCVAPLSLSAGHDLEEIAVAVFRSVPLTEHFFAHLHRQVLPPHKPTELVPFTSVLIEALSNVSEPPIKTILALLDFNIPPLLPKLLRLIEKRRLSLSPADAVASLAAIGGAITAASVSSGPELAYVLGPTEGFARAAVLRELLDSAAYDSAVEFEDAAWLGLLAVLSLRFRSHRLRKVRWANRVWRVLSVDVFRWVLADEDGMQIVLPALDPVSLRARPRPFEDVQPAPVGPVSPAFVQRVIASLATHRVLAEQALAELSFATPIAPDVFAPISPSATASPDRSIIPLGQADSICFKVERKQTVVFGSSDSTIDAVSIEIDSTRMKIGALTLTTRPHKDKIPDFVRITRFGPVGRLIIQRGDSFILTDRQVGHLREPTLYFAVPTNGTAPPTCGPDVLPFPAFLRRAFASRARRFTHVLAGDHLAVIPGWSGESHPVLLLPPIVPIILQYAEFDFEFAQPEKAGVLIVEGETLTVPLYVHELDVSGKATIGLGFDPASGAAFATVNGALIPESVAPLPPGFNAYVFRAEAGVTMLNVGALPFECRNVAEVAQALPELLVGRAPKQHRTADALPSFAIHTNVEMTAEALYRPVASDPKERPAVMFEADGCITAGVLQSGGLETEGFVSRLIPQSAAIRSPFDRLETAELRAQALSKWRRTIPPGFCDEVQSSRDLSHLEKPENIERAAARVRFTATTNTRVRAARGDDDVVSFVEAAGGALSDRQTLSGHVSFEFGNLLASVRQSSESGFVRLAARAVEVLRKPCRPQVIAAQYSLTSDEYCFGNVDAVWLGATPLSPTDTVVLVDDTRIALRRPFGQLTIRGGVFRLPDAHRDYVQVLPILLSKEGRGFAVHFVNYLLKTAPSDELSRKLLCETVLLPLLDDIQEGRFVLFTETYGRWFAAALEGEFLLPDDLKPFAKLLRIAQLHHITDPYLATGVTLFSAFAYSNADPTPSEVRDRIALFLDALTNDCDSFAARISRRLAFELVSPFGNSLSLLGCVKTLSLPVITSFSRSSGAPIAPGDPTVLNPRDLPGPSHTREFSVPHAVRYTVSLAHRPPLNSAFLRINGHLRVDTDFEVISPTFTLTILTGQQSYPPVTVRAFAPPTPLDPSAVAAAYSSLSTSLTPAADAVLFYAAQIAYRAGASDCPDGVLAQLIPGVPPSAAGQRLNQHRALVGPRVALPGFAQSRWLAPLHAQPALFAQDAKIALDDADAVAFFAGVARLLPVVPLDRGPFPRKLAAGAPVHARLRSLWGSLFAQNAASAWLPRADADRAALAGFGRWMAWIWSAGKRLPLRLSRVVIRSAFGGRLRADDFADVDPEFADSRPSESAMEQWVESRESALAAIRVGVVAGRIVVDDDPLFPRIFQLRPFKVTLDAEQQKSGTPFDALIRKFQ